MKIKFYNHACFSIENDQSILLNDPYLCGTAFNDGWDLIVNDIEFNFDTKKKIFIFYSHEHPDHFSISFFIKITSWFSLFLPMFLDTKSSMLKSTLDNSLNIIL